MKRIASQVLYLITIIVLTLSWIFVQQIGFANGSGDDIISQPKNGKLVGDKFLAKLHLRDHVEAVDELFLEVQVYPTVDGKESDFPGTIIDTSKVIPTATNSWYKIIIRGIDVPVADPSRIKPIDEVDREMERYDDAVHYVWELCHNSRTLVLMNPVAGEYNDVICDVYIVIGDKMMNLAAMLIADGHASPEPDKLNWGHKLPRPIQEFPWK